MKKYIRNNIYKGQPGLVIEHNYEWITIRNCVFIDLIKQHQVSLETLILADGRWPGGVEPI